ncbi:MAG TPA: hypothetical protein VIY73_04500 [Polyangiaceae bacterium]
MSDSNRNAPGANLGAIFAAPPPDVLDGIAADIIARRGARPVWEPLDRRALSSHVERVLLDHRIDDGTLLVVDREDRHGALAAISLAPEDVPMLRRAVAYLEADAAKKAAP